MAAWDAECAFWDNQEATLVAMQCDPDPKAGLAQEPHMTKRTTIETRAGHFLLTLRDERGKVVRVEKFATHEEAMQAAHEANVVPPDVDTPSDQDHKNPGRVPGRGRRE